MRFHSYVRRSAPAQPPAAPTPKVRVRNRTPTRKIYVGLYWNELDNEWTPFIRDTKDAALAMNCRPLARSVAISVPADYAACKKEATTQVKRTLREQQRLHGTAAI